MLSKIVANLIKLILVISIVMLSSLVFDIINFKSLPPHEVLQILWSRDISNLSRNKQLPSIWEQIGEVDLIGTDPLSKKWAKNLKFPGQVLTSGKYRLEILIVRWRDSDTNKDGVILQYDISDRTTDNLVWELGRTFTLKTSN